jgi:hypothetical protein
MSSPATPPLSVGVIGLGPLWRRRYRPALLGQADRFHIAAVCDAAVLRARDEALDLDCALAEGPSALLATPGLDAVLLIDPQWYRLWPLEAACRAGKAVFCAASPAADPDHATTVMQMAVASERPVVFADAVHHGRALRHARSLLRRPALGAVQALFAEAVVKRALDVDMALTDLLSACLDLVPEPQQFHSCTLATGDRAVLRSLAWVGAGGAVAQLSVVLRPVDNLSSAGPPQFRARLITTQGGARLKWPDHLQWSTRRVRAQTRRKRTRTVEERRLAHFHALLTSGARDSTENQRFSELCTLLKTARQSEPPAAVPQPVNVARCDAR